MKRVLPVFALLLSTLSVHAQPVSQALAIKLQFALDSTAAAQKMTGVHANMIISDGSTWNGYTGYENPFTQEPLNTTDLWWSASMCKVFIGGIALQLVDEGKMTLEDKVGKYFTDLTYVDTNITIRELLKHRSGIKDVLNNTSTQQWYTNPDKVWTGKEVMNTFGAPKEFNHGGGFSYSNANYILMSMIIEKITGNTVGKELKDRFFVPLGMNHSYFMPEQAPSEDVVTCWADFNGDKVWDDECNFIHSTSFASMVSGAGAILTKSDEVSRYTRALFSGQLCTSTLLSEMKQCTNVSFGANSTGYGISTMRYKFFNRDYYGHGGDISGFTTLTIHQPETNVTLTLMINNDLQNRAALASALLKALNNYTTEISERLMEDKLQILQNPVRNVLNAHFSGSTEKLKASIIGVDGKVLLSDSHFDSEFSFDLSTFDAGIYQLVISDGVDQLAKRFIKL